MLFNLGPRHQVPAVSSRYQPRCLIPFFNQLFSTPGLLINFVHHYWPSLLKIDGFLQEFITPIVKVSKGKSYNRAAAFVRVRQPGGQDDAASNICLDVIIVGLLNLTWGLRFSRRGLLERLMHPVLGREKRSNCRQE